MQSIARDSEDSTDDEFFDAHGKIRVHLPHDHLKVVNVSPVKQYFKKIIRQKQLQKADYLTRCF